MFTRKTCVIRSVHLAMQLGALLLSSLFALATNADTDKSMLPEESLEAGLSSIYDTISTERLKRLALYGLNAASDAERRAFDEGLAHFKVAAKAGLAEAQFQYGYFLVWTIEQDATPGEVVVTPNGAKFPNQQANMELFEEADRWFLLAAEQDHPLANYMVGVKALNVDAGLANSRSQARVVDLEKLRFLKRAAEQGVPGAQELLDSVPATAME